MSGRAGARRAILVQQDSRDTREPAIAGIRALPQLFSGFLELVISHGHPLARDTAKKSHHYNCFWAELPVMWYYH
jgi:hypothetical protein